MALGPYLSHHNYPADGGDQVGRTAGSVLGLEAGSSLAG